MAEQPRILVVDDERHIRELLEIGLGGEGYDVRAVPDGQACLQAVRDWSPELVVLDVMLPKVDGVALLPKLRQLTEAPIIMLSAKGEMADKIAGLGGGADDYIAKPFEMQELLARIETALRRPRLAYPTALRYADLVVDLETRDVQRSGRKIELSAREFDLLVTLLRHPHRVFSRDQLLDLETYISYLRAKVDADFNPKLIQTHRGAGYSLREA